MIRRGRNVKHEEKESKGGSQAGVRSRTSPGTLKPQPRVIPFKRYIRDGFLVQLPQRTALNQFSFATGGNWVRMLKNVEREIVSRVPGCRAEGGQANRQKQQNVTIMVHLPSDLKVIL